MQWSCKHTGICMPVSTPSVFIAAQVTSSNGYCSDAQEILLESSTLITHTGVVSKHKRKCTYVLHGVTCNLSCLWLLLTHMVNIMDSVIIKSLQELSFLKYVRVSLFAEDNILLFETNNFHSVSVACECFLLTVWIPMWQEGPLVVVNNATVE